MKRIATFGLFGLALVLAGCGWILGPEPWSNTTNPIALTPVDPAALPDSQILPVPIEGDYIEGEIIIGYEDEASLARAAELVNKLVNGSVKHTNTRINAALVRISGMGVLEALGRLAWAVWRGELSGIRYAEPNYLRDLIEPFPPGGLETMTAVEPKVYDPNADLRPYQWALDLVRAEEAWPYATGRDIIVAVVDTGVDGGHRDLVGRVEPVWYDAWNLRWVAGDDSSWRPVWSPRFRRWYEGSHGTHVAGISAAKADGVGITGLAPNVKILSIRIFSPDPVPLPAPYGHYYVGDYNTAMGIVEAVAYGAKVLNNSWGGKGYSQTLKAAIDYALASNAIFVASMGNSYLDELIYPAGYPGVLAVGATTPQDEKVDFSTSGGHISIGAPGTRVLSCVPRWMGQAGTGLPLLYSYWDGTSMSAPYVSALAAMVLERNPTATPYQVRRVIEQTAKDIEIPGFDRRTGYGRIDAARAVQTTTLPSEGAKVAVFVIAASSEPIGVLFIIPYVDITLRKGGIDRYFGQTDFEGWYYGILPYPGLGLFFEVEPGTYDVLAGGQDTTGYWGRVANRVTGQTTVTLNPGINDPVIIEVNTTLQVTLTWDENVDLDLAIHEYDRATGTYRWSTPKTGGLWGTFSGDVQAGGSETYTLGFPHWPDIYYLGIIAYGNSRTARVTVVQNGVTERYGPYTLTGDPAGALYPSWTWTDWWENRVHPLFDVSGPGGPVVY